MSIANVKRGALLAEARERLDDVRSGLKAKKLETGMKLQVVAFDGDESGGCHHGSTLIPAYLGQKILDRIEEILDDELTALDIVPPKHIKI